MFDLSLPVQPTSRTHGFTHGLQNAVPDPSLPFALTLSRQTLAGSMSGENAPAVLDRFPTLAEAMGGAIHHAEEFAPDTAAQLLAILDRDDRLVLAGAACDGAVAWCHPVMSAAEARAVVSEASQLRAQAGRAADWSETDLVQRLRHHADLLDARLVDPQWRAFAARALQIAARRPRDRGGQGGLASFAG